MALTWQKGGDILPATFFEPAKASNTLGFSQVLREGDKLLKVKHRNGLTATAILLILAVAQLYVTVGFASPTAGNSAGAAPQIMGVLTTRDNKAITVNGAAAVSGASIPSGAEIVTPDGVGATLRLGALGTLCIAPGSQVTVEFSDGIIKVTVTAGCVILSTKKGTTGTVITPQGTAGQTDANGGSIDVCSRPGAATAVNQGAAADAGAGASALDCGAAGAAAAPPVGIPATAVGAMIGGGAAALYFLFRGGNPSPSA